jgi:NAD(P)-dependent dehydrogenase (short-subunit alcohol dehydrogenase family)
MFYFITGGSRGIGANLVLEAVRRGHDVAFTFVRNEELAQQVANEARAINADVRLRIDQLDVRDSGEVETVVERVVDDFGGIDVLINNAGIARDNLLVSMSDEEWLDVLATNLNGPFFVCRQVLPTMMGQRFGRIINISSLVHGGASGQANYSASKAGLNGLTQTIAKEYGRKGITANTVVPGFFETDMTLEAMPEQIRAFWQQYCPVPKGRVGQLQELSAVVHFLASKEAAFVNGQAINVTAGLDWSP